MVAPDPPWISRESRPRRLAVRAADVRRQARTRGDSLPSGSPRSPAVGDALDPDRRNERQGLGPAMVDAMLLAHDRTGGLYTSPHLVRPNERIRIGGSD